MEYQFRPLGDWTGPSTPAQQRSYPRFKAAYSDTLGLLASEAEKLGPRRMVLQVDLAERDIRLDGLPRSSARYGSHPGVAVSFESRFGPLRYATDEYTDWKANLRAIALSLKALRDVDRYGVSKRGEQYTGWKARPSGGTVTFPSADEALRWMREMSGVAGAEGMSVPMLYRLLAKRLHPDAGGTAEDWDRLDAAKQMLTQAGML